VKNVEKSELGGECEEALIVYQHEVSWNV